MITALRSFPIQMLMKPGNMIAENDRNTSCIWIVMTESERFVIYGEKTKKCSIELAGEKHDQTISPWKYGNCTRMQGSRR